MSSFPRDLRPTGPPRHWATRYLLATAIVAAASAVRWCVDPFVHDQIPYFVYVGAVVVATWTSGTDGGLLSVVLAAFAGNYLFVSPRYVLLPEQEDWAAMMLFAVMGAVLVAIVGRWKHAERRLHAQAYQLQEQAVDLDTANRLKDEFLATLSHELRTPLNAILGWAHLLQREGLDDSRRKQAAATVVRNAVAQARLVDDILDVSAIVNGRLALRPERVDLAAVARSAIEMVHPAAEAKALTIRAVCPPTAAMVGDEGRLRQVVWNLLSNSVKFSEKGGVIDVRIEAARSGFALTVSDTGCGIDPAFLPSVFQPFRQADSSMTRRHGGLGLGLAIVRRLTELHGGVVSVHSEGAGRGATFTVHLPVRAVVPPAPQPAGAVTATLPEPPSAPVALDGVKVLVVDDDADSRELITEVLSGAGATTRTTATGRDALSEVRRWRPDVLIADIGMPDEDGYTLVRQVRGLLGPDGGETPAVALTANARPQDRAVALAAGFSEHVSKPVSPEALVAVVARFANVSPRASSG